MVHWSKWIVGIRDDSDTLLLKRNVAIRCCAFEMNVLPLSVQTR